MIVNFKEYIEKDIEEKTSLLKLMPLNTETRVNNYKVKIDEIAAAYKKNIASTKKFLFYKYDKLCPTRVDRSKKIKEVYDVKESYKDIFKVTNSITSFYEKMGIDDLIFTLEHYYNNTLEVNNDTIVKIISKFSFAKCKISADDFKINTYSYNYMYYIFLSLNEVEVPIDIFKDIFWKCPKVFNNIIISFRLLLDRYSRQFTSFVKSYERILLASNGFKTKDDLINRFHELSAQIEGLEDDDENDIIYKFMQGDLDFTFYESIKDTLYSELDFFLIQPVDTKNKVLVEDTVSKIVGLYDNLVEYSIYRKNEALFEEIKKMYVKNVEKQEIKKMNADINNQRKTISKLFKQAKKMFVNKKIDINNLDSAFTNKEIDTLLNQQNILNDLYSEYVKYDKMYFDRVLKNNINNNSFICDVIYLIISYPFFTCSIIKKVFELETREEVLQKFDDLLELFYNRKRKIIDLKSFFSKDNFEVSLMDAYRFDNLNVNESTFEEDGQNLVFTNYTKLINKRKIIKFKHSIEEIDFLIKVKKLKDEEENTN